MKLIEVILKTEAPVILSESGGLSFLAYTKDFIPGTVIRGLFANSYIKLKGLSTTNAHEDQTFYNYFLSNKVSFGNAYIATLHNQGTSIKENYPLPLSLQHEKNDKSKIIDLLLETREERGIEQTKPFLGYGNIENNGLSIEQVEKSFFFHHQRDKKTGAPEENKFFNYEGLAQDQLFKGDIRFEEGNFAKDFWNNFKNDHNGELIYFIGRSRNSQYGRVSLKLSPPQDFEDITFNGSSFVLTFISDAILVNKRGHPCTDKASIQEFLQEFLQIDSLKIEIEKAFLRIKTIENYVSVWKLRRPTDLAIRAGSCLLIRTNGDLLNNPSFKKAYFLGLGERTAEGFGRFKINWQKANISYYNQPQTNQISSPDINQELISSLQRPDNNQAKNIAIEVIKNYLRRTTQAVAYEDANKIDEESLGHTSKGPLARLEKAIYEFRTIEKIKQEFLNKSRPAYQESLKKIKTNNTNQNLFDSLINLNSKEKIFPAQPDGNLRSFINALESNLLDEMKSNLEYLYLKTFITALRYKQKILQKKTP